MATKSTKRRKKIGPEAEDESGRRVLEIGVRSPEAAATGAHTHPAGAASRQFFRLRAHGRTVWSPDFTTERTESTETRKALPRPAKIGPFCVPLCFLWPILPGSRGTGAGRQKLGARRRQPAGAASATSASANPPRSIVPSASPALGSSSPYSRPVLTRHLRGLRVASPALWSLCLLCALCDKKSRSPSSPLVATTTPPRLRAHRDLRGKMV